VVKILGLGQIFTSARTYFSTKNWNPEGAPRTLRVHKIPKTKFNNLLKKIGGEKGDEAARY